MQSTGKVEEIQHLEINSAVHNERPIEDLKQDRLLDAQLKSSFDDLTIFQALKTFKKAALICAIAGIAASTDGTSFTAV
jgi:hypothetical protein